PWMIALLRTRFARPTRLIALVAIGIAGLLGSAAAATWNESGDAGNLPFNAQNTAGVGPLTSITGNIASLGDQDMYCIQITDPAQFSACFLCAGISDPDLFLFRPSGVGVSAVQLCQAGCKALSGTFVSGSGLYLLALAPHGTLALSGSNDIWLPGTTAERAPDGPG